MGLAMILSSTMKRQALEKALYQQERRQGIPRHLFAAATRRNTCTTPICAAPLALVVSASLIEVSLAPSSTLSGGGRPLRELDDGTLSACKGRPWLSAVASTDDAKPVFLPLSIALRDRHSCSGGTPQQVAVALAAGPTAVAVAVAVRGPGRVAEICSLTGGAPWTIGTMSHLDVTCAASIRGASAPASSAALPPMASLPDLDECTFGPRVGVAGDLRGILARLLQDAVEDIIIVVGFQLWKLCIRNALDGSCIGRPNTCSGRGGSGTLCALATGSEILATAEMAPCEDEARAFGRVAPRRGAG